MDLTGFNLEGLQSLHISYKRVLQNHIKQLEDLTADVDYYDAIVMLLKQKITLFEEQIFLIERRINELSSQKLRFSVEFMFWYYGIGSRSVQVHFITTSNAYKTYGAYVTGQVLFEESEFPELIERVRLKGHSDGIIKFEEIVSHEMPAETKEKLKNEGFYASEISEIY